VVACSPRDSSIVYTAANRYELQIEKSPQYSNTNPYSCLHKLLAVPIKWRELAGHCPIPCALRDAIDTIDRIAYIALNDFELFFDNLSHFVLKQKH